MISTFLAALLIRLPVALVAVHHWEPAEATDPSEQCHRMVGWYRIWKVWVHGLGKSPNIPNIQRTGQQANKKTNQPSSTRTFFPLQTGDRKCCHQLRSQGLWSHDARTFFARAALGNGCNRRPGRDWTRLGGRAGRILTDVEKTGFFPLAQLLLYLGFYLFFSSLATWPCQVQACRSTLKLRRSGRTAQESE